jgi:hypothetical protein
LKRGNSDSRAIIDSAKQFAIQSTSEILGLDPQRPALRLVLRAWLVTVNEVAVAWIQDRFRFPAEDMVELLTASLSELLRQAARPDSAPGAEHVDTEAERCNRSLADDHREKFVQSWRRLGFLGFQPSVCRMWVLDRRWPM